MKKFYISTPIYYSSGSPHIGHAYTTILADALSRYKKILGYEIFFITGMDEHGQKIENICKIENTSFQDLVDKNANIFLNLWKKLDINFTQFIRTTNNFHKKFVQEKFSYLFKKGYIYLDKWVSNYCIQCEEDIVDNKIRIINNKIFCEHGHEVISRSEDSYFLKIKDFKNWIIEILNDELIKIIPNNRLNELKKNFLNDNFRDLSISRKNINLGIDIKENSEHKIYVWFDALLNYLSGLYLYNNSYIEKFWNSNNTEIVHLLSKEITRFHCIYWPIILKMLNYKLPNKIIAHGWIITNEGKMSKSLGNVVNPLDLLEKYESDSIRYYLLKEISINNDSVFSNELLIITHNSDLCNNFGNIINRVIGLLNKYNNSKIPKYIEPSDENLILFENKIKKFIYDIEILINELDINLIIKSIINFEFEINSFIENTKPWNLNKENKKNLLENFLSILSNSIKVLIFFISPIIVKKSKKAWSLMNFDLSIFNIKDIKNFKNIDNVKINSPEILFERIE